MCATRASGTNAFQHEMGYTNVLTMLDLGGVPLRSEARGDGDPIVVAGGPGALVPEPVAPFFDLFCVGEDRPYTFTVKWQCGWHCQGPLRAHNGRRRDPATILR